VLDGGLSKGELGVWMADSKGGKSLFLVHLAGYTARASGRNTLMILLEGSWLQTSSRLDAWHTHSLYRDVKRGTFTRETYEQMQSEYRRMKQKLVIRAMTDKWNYSAADIRSELDDLYTQFGWRPDQLIVDYGDLLRSQMKVYSEEEHQRNAFSDLKAMTTQDHGYSIWSASQAKRPRDEKFRPKKKGGDPSDGDGSSIIFGKPVLGPKDIADSYNKIRRSDFIGSINQDSEDKLNDIARLYCALYRDNAADRLVRIKQVLDEMRFVDLMDPLNRPDRPEAIGQQLDKQRKQAAAQTADNAEGQLGL
jgi:replicative DNA helicase